MSRIDKFKGVIPAFFACYDESGEVSPERVRAFTPKKSTIKKTPLRIMPRYISPQPGMKANRKVNSLLFLICGKTPLNGKALEDLV